MQSIIDGSLSFTATSESSGNGWLSDDRVVVGEYISLWSKIWMCSSVNCH